jgi:hypothetical protein
MDGAYNTRWENEKYLQNFDLDAPNRTRVAYIRVGGWKMVK